MIWTEKPKGFALGKHMIKVARMEAHLKPYIGKTFTEDLAKDLYENLADRLRYPRVSALAVRLDEVVPRYGEEFGVKASKQIGLYLVEHNDVLRKGNMPELWTGTPPLWMCLRIVQVSRKEILKKGAPLMYDCRVLVMTGPASGLVMTLPISARYAYYLPKILGCPKRSVVEPHDAVSMHGLAKLGTAPGKSMSIMELSAPTGLATMNKDLYRRRHKPS